ncbi:MAG: hypothetical protein K8F30_12775, partial [Taibaiella sp.]|nr:hypothetical protein [Taibaiella sp.]
SEAAHDKAAEEKNDIMVINKIQIMFFFLDPAPFCLNLIFLSSAERLLTSSTKANLRLKL